MEQIKRIDRKLVHSGSILDFYEDTMLLPNGKTEKWDFISHRMGAACVLAVKPDGKILMVRQYRNALNRETLEIPAGKRDSANEDTAVCAARELEEETGYRAGKIEKLLSLKSTVAFCDELIDVYLATELEKVGEQKLDESEEIDIEEWDLKDLLDMCFSGKMQDAKTVAAIMAYAVKCRN
ncbi:ADP-ribose pyrophosphatase [Pseudobutyrivibrio sp. 49]|uniref:NUDIX hydrolase n=1 Tax=Pseudobutyrivibrio sp. 49 TaxID=1855344 RepID=UPI0008818DF5|nr:NUDIX hydrolase [Pseudobutyrivibrio sp. 49]SDH30531.1 ADP-ribose pyrophosphatase [Pseudobutyrivibrio sp. 49]